LDFELSAEQSLLRSRARQFARDAVAPKAAHFDRAAIFPHEILDQARTEGLLHLTVPAQFGGAGLGILEQAIVNEELAWGCAGICAALGLNALAISALTTGGAPEQQKRYLARILDGELAGFAVTEPTGGSDLTALRTTASDANVLTGHKTWISNATEASFFVVVARTDDGLGAFLVERTAPGLTVGPPLGKLGQRANPAAELRLDRVPGEPLAGWRVFDRSRPLVASYGVGLAQRCLDEAIGYARRRHSMGRPIIEHQAVGHKLAEIGMRLAAARLLTYRAAWLCDRGRPSSRESAYAKTFAADTAMWAASETLQVFGGAGYGTDQPVEKLFRDAKLLQIYEGTGEIQRTIMVRELARGGAAS
jgi:acyl-CoA dehydrogenase